MKETFIDTIAHNFHSNAVKSEGQRAVLQKRIKEKEGGREERDEKNRRSFED